MSLKSNSEESLNLMQLQTQQKMILELFQCEDIVEKKYLKSMAHSREKKVTMSSGIGENGSGKSMLIKIIAGVLYPDEGSLR